MIDDKITSILNIAFLQVKYLQEAYDDIYYQYPFTGIFVTSMSKDELRILDTMINRFSKLQDIIGAKIIDICLLQESESIIGLSILDKINKLEKLAIIESAETWVALRNIRNHVVHEYPSNPQLAADNLNKLYSLIPQLLEIYRKLVTKIQVNNSWLIARSLE